MKATWQGKVIAESAKTIEVDGYRYFPRDAVKMQLLKQAPKTPDDLECPNGVQFYDVVDGPRRSARAAWAYEKPGAGRKQVENWIGVGEDVTVA